MRIALTAAFLALLRHASSNIIGSAGHHKGPVSKSSKTLAIVLIEMSCFIGVLIMAYVCSTRKAKEDPEPGREMQRLDGSTLDIAS
jgi:hypothetical protein